MLRPASPPGKPIDPGWLARLDILRRDADRSILGPLRTHAWKAAVEQEVQEGEYLIISAERGGHRHLIALLYTSATENGVYKRLASQVEQIFFNGAPYQVESFAFGLDKPPTSISTFHTMLLEWNQTSSDGKFVPMDEAAAPILSTRPRRRLLLSEEPIQAIWLRLRQFQSVTIARKLIEERAVSEGLQLSDDVVHSKAEGLAHALRNATDYFRPGESQNVSQRILSLYYGSLAFAFAEMLAIPRGFKTLTEIENSTKQGHGLYTIDGRGEGLEQLVVGIISAGFFPVWMKSLHMTTEAVPSKKPRTYEDLASLPEGSWLTIERLFASIPEVSDLFADIFDSPTAWVAPIYDMGANSRGSVFGPQERPERSYVILSDEYARLTREDIAALPGPISEIREVPAEHGGRHFRVAIDHPGKSIWWEALNVHHSPFENAALLMPIFGTVNEYRAICVVLLYALSIVVRYRPSVWRRVQEGDLDHMRVLIEAFLAVVERVLPEQFLETVTGQRVFAKQPGSLF